jgi:hypothetical protein
MTTEQQKKSIDLLRLVLREGTTNKTTEILIEEFLIKILKSEQPKPLSI